MFGFFFHCYESWYEETVRVLLPEWRVGSRMHYPLFFWSENRDDQVEGAGWGGALRLLHIILALSTSWTADARGIIVWRQPRISVEATLSFSPQISPIDNSWILWSCYCGACKSSHNINRAQTTTLPHSTAAKVHLSHPSTPEEKRKSGQGMSSRLCNPPSWQ